jgi:predicted TPR repeat methyltransferase
MWQRNDRILYFLTVVFYYYFFLAFGTRSDVSLGDILSQADDLLLQGQIEPAIGVYRNGIHVARQQQILAATAAAAVEHNNDANDDDDDDVSSLTVLLSLYTNLGTALSSFQTEQDNQHAAIESYQSALQLYEERYHPLDKNFNLSEAADQAQRSAATSIAASAAFYLGMVYQDLAQHQYAAAAIESYSLAISLDGNHWAAAANRGSVQQDVLKDYRSALISYNLAYGILTRNDDDDDDPPTDPPEELPVVLSQLQYRIGLCITYGDATTTTTTTTTQQKKKCIVQDDPDQRPVDCHELATHAFALAVQYDAYNELAQHMLATMTADASMVRASNAYVTALFDDYATSFEHSLVNELHYDGFARLRRGFDRAMLENGVNVNPKLFDTVLDAGCGTGLAGEQFRNISRTLIGVDLSRAILDQAVSQRPGLYDAVIAGDVIQTFHDKASSLSLIIAADSFIYFGNLDPLLAALHIGLTNDGGLAAFTLENVNVDDEHILVSTKNDWRWQLTASGRFAHRKDYVVLAAQQHGFAVEYYEPLNGAYVCV